MLACVCSSMVKSVVREHRDAVYSNILMEAASLPAAGATCVTLCSPLR